MGELIRASGLILKGYGTPEMLSPFISHFFFLLQDPADQRVLLAREGSWKLWCVPGLSMLPGLRPGSLPHLWIALRRVPRADEGEWRGREKANRGPGRFGAAILTLLSPDSLGSQWAGAGTDLTIHYAQHKIPGCPGALPLQS